MVDDFGRALGILALNALAAAGSAAVCYAASRAILGAMVRQGSPVVPIAAVAVAVLLGAGGWLAAKGKAIGWWLAGLGGLTLILVAVAFLACGQSNPAQLIGIGGGLLGVLAVWLLFIVNRWGWRWIWRSKP